MERTAARSSDASSSCVLDAVTASRDATRPSAWYCLQRGEEEGRGGDDGPAAVVRHVHRAGADDVAPWYAVRRGEKRELIT